MREVHQRLGRKANSGLNFRCQMERAMEVDNQVAELRRCETAELAMR